jgi:CPA1 family monovalent cation:H+ antiporter
VRAVGIVLGLVALAAVVATVAGRLRAPAPSLLVVAGLVVGLLPGVPAIAVSPEIVSLVVLPPLLFAAASDLSPPDLRAVLRPVVALAVGLVAVSAFVVALVVRLLLPQVPFSAALVLGAVLASTDPVAVTALARRLQLPPRLLTLVQAESLFNDATSLVLFRVAVTASVAAGAVGPLEVVGQFVWLGGAGALAGLVVALVIEQLRRRTEDAVLETLMALMTPYAAFVLAELVHASGVTAVVAAGLWLGARSVLLSSGPVRLQVDTVYAVVVFILESVVFAVIGLQFPGLVADLAPQDAGFVPVALAVTAAMLVTRVAFLAPLAFLPRLSRPGGSRREPAGPPPWRSVAVVWWAGARGVVPLAAALSIPLTVDGGGAFPERNLLLVLATSCIIITLVVQGFTLQPLVRRLGVAEDPARTAREEAVARHAAAVAARARLLELLDVEAAPPAVADRLLATLDQRIERTGRRLERTQGEARPSRAEQDGVASAGQVYRTLRRDLLAVETAELLRLRDTGIISEDVRRRVQRTLDLEEAGLADEGS